MMKNSLLFGLSLLPLFGAIILSGCKQSETDPGYVALAEIRFADYHQVDPIKIYMTPKGQTAPDSTKTYSSMTYGMVTPYFTNLSTNREKGETYILTAKNSANNNTVVASEEVTLHPGDKYTWLISGPGGTFDTTLISDLHGGAADSSMEFFRFLNVTPDLTLDLRTEDPISGQLVAGGITYRHFSDYVGVPKPKGGIGTNGPATLSFYVVSNGIVVGRITGIGFVPATYHTIAWGGEDQGHRHKPPTLQDTFRIHIWDDDVLAGSNTTFSSIPQTFRYNLINALLPPIIPKANFPDYTQSGGAFDILRQYILCL